MRIGIDARLYGETGVGRYIRNLVNYLQDIDNNNSYTLFVPVGSSTSSLGISNPLWNIKPTSIRWHTVSEQLQFPRILEKEQFDLVHFPYFSVPVFYKGPYVLTIHDLIINHFSTGKASTLPFPAYYVKRFAYQRIIKKAAKDAKKILTVSHATQDEIVSLLHVPAEKVVVTYEGIDGSLIPGIEHTAKKYGKYLLYVGNAYPHKNLDRLVAAFDLVHKTHPEIKLLLVGRKNYFYDRLSRDVERLGLQQNIHFLGEVDDASLKNLYHEAMALLTPSLMEGFGLPGLEAMAQKCLVLASDIPVYREIYQDACLYFQPTSIEAIHATILRVLEQKENFASIRVRGIKRVQDFSWKKMAQETRDVYESSISV